MPWPQESSRFRFACIPALATGASYALAQPPFSVWPLAFVCLAPLAFAIRGRPLRERLALGAFAGAAAAWATSLAPAAVGLARFFDRSLAFGIVCAALVTAGVGAPAFALVAGLAGDMPRRFAWIAPWRFGVAFAAGEWVRSNVASGVPWLLLAHSLAPAPSIAQLAGPIGVAGLGLAIAVANGVVVALVAGPARRAALASGGLLAATFWLAAVSAPEIAPGDAGSIAVVAAGSARPEHALRVSLVQPATPLAWSGDASRVRDRLARLAALTRQSLPVALAVWPESSIEAPLPANGALVREALAGIDPRPALLFGAPRYDAAAPTRLYNSALLWDANGAARGAHDKVQLMPFTEFVPAALAALGIRGGHTAAAAVLRAIETRRPLLRATASGITVAIDARGRVVGRLATGSAGVLIVDVVPVRSAHAASRR